jgi:hypothetical protein
MTVKIHCRVFRIQQRVEIINISLPNFRRNLLPSSSGSIMKPEDFPMNTQRNRSPCLRIQTIFRDFTLEMHTVRSIVHWAIYRTKKSCA